MKLQVIVAAMLCLSCQQVSAQTTRPLNEQIPSWSTVTFDGIRGWRFQCNAQNVTVTELGCYYPDSASQPKTISIWDFNSQQVLGQVTTTPGTGWRWEPLAQPVPLQIGSQYVVAARSLTGHYFNNGVGSTTWTPTGAIQYIEMRYQNSPTSASHFPTGVITNSQHGVVDIGYTTGPPSEIEVEYNSAPVANAGNVNVGDARTQIGDTFTFDIFSNGAGDLELTGNPPVSITPGLNCAAATGVQAQPSLTTIPQSGSTTFTLNIEPTGTGPFDLLVSIPNNDPAANPFEFTVQGNGILPNDEAFAVIAPGSSLAGGTNGPFTIALDPGQALASVAIELQDPENDNIAITAIDLPTTLPVGIVPPTVPTTPSHPVPLEWTGTADASSTPGSYTWTVHFADVVNATPIAVDITITINNLAPNHAIADADSGGGTNADPYRTAYTQGEDASRSVDMATISDPNTSQALSVTGIALGANPQGGVGFQIDLNGGVLSLAPNGVLTIDDAGTHTFTVSISDGSLSTDVRLSVLVYSMSGAIVFDTPSPLPDGVVNAPYSAQISVSGASGTTAFSLESGSLPQGVSLSGAGALSGTPLATGMFTFTVRVLDSSNDVAVQPYSLEIKSPPPPPVSGTGSTGGSSGCTASAGSWLAVLMAGILPALARRRRERD